VTVELTHLVAGRREIVSRSIAKLKPGERTVIAEILADELIDRIGDALARSDTAALEAWLEEAYSRHSNLPYLSAVLKRTCRTLLDVGGADGWLRNRDVTTRIAGSIAGAIRRPRPATIEISSESIDEIDVAINDLVARLFEKDVLTGEHSRAVALWCVRLARRLGLDAAQTQLVQRGGLMHDIGKIATPIDILNAPRRLTKHERFVIERHPIDGVEMVADIPQLEELVPMIRSHHERLDGKGYPDGLRGEQIPLLARIVSVADCFNAMIGRRPYRPPLSPSIALEELTRHTGTQFDPDIVEAMTWLVADHSERL
jgi:putative nucleotidyltransferase with HDIG domain